MATNALTTAGRFLARRERPNRPAMDNAFRRSWCPHFGVRFMKAQYWLKQFGTAQVVPAAALAGVDKVLNLEQAQTRGLALFWSHDLDALGAFIESTR